MLNGGDQRLLNLTFSASSYFGDSTPNVIVLSNPAAFESLNAVISADAVNREQ